jgi:hypothetical protein
MAESPNRDIALGAFFTGIAQAGLWAALCVGLAVGGSRFEAIFADFGVALPALTVLTFQLLAILRIYWYLPVVLCCLWPLVNLGVVLLLSLKPDVALPRRIWYLLTWFAPILSAMLIFGALAIPMASLMSGLSS